MLLIIYQHLVYRIGFYWLHGPRYNDTSPTLGPANIFLGITKRLQGFIVRDHYDMINQFLDDMAKKKDQMEGNSIRGS